MLSLHRQLRCTSTSSFRRYLSSASQDIRPRLMADLKTAMKNKNTLASTTIRSVLSEVYAADKSHPSPIGNAAIISIIRKAALRRADNALQFERGARLDLAEKEHQEHAFLSQFLPSLLPQSEIDTVLTQAISELNTSASGSEPKRMLGQVFKAFYTRIDRSIVDPELVKKRAEVLLTTIIRPS